MGRCLTTVILACLFFFPSFSTAAEIAKPWDVSRLFNVFLPVPGAWSEYAILDKSTWRREVLRMSIVESEADGYWYEFASRGKENSNIVKMFVTGGPVGPYKIQRFILKDGISHAREIAPGSMPMARRIASRIFEQWSGILSGSTVNLRNIKTGVDTIVVPAGTFDVSRRKIMDIEGKVYARYMFSEDVYPFGIIVFGAENATMVLVGHGAGAESLITGKPAIIKPSPEIMEGMLRGMFPGMAPPQGMGGYPGNNIRQMPGMGTGYESK
jgi:hypothetical protein